MVRSSLIGIAVVFSVFWGTGHAAPQVPQDAQAPFVQSVSFYKDWRLTQPITTAVEPGTTIYTKIVFSEPMKLKVADDNTARPVLYCRVGEERIRYRIAGHGASGEDFASGDAKPLHSGTDDYICKFTLPEGWTGEFTTMVGKLSADTSGNTIASFYTHPDRLTISGADMTPVVITGGRAPNLPQPTDPPIDQLTGTPVDTETLIELLDTTDTITVVDAAPGEKPRDAAFIFKKFIEHLISDMKALFPYTSEEAFQPPGKGFIHPSREAFGLHFGSRPPNFHVLGTFIPDPITYCTLQQINDFSKKYQLTKKEVRHLLRNLYVARMIVWPYSDWLQIPIPDENLRKAVVARINELRISMTGTPKIPIHPIYWGELGRIRSLQAEATGIESLEGLEYAIHLERLFLGNIFHQDWHVISIETQRNDGVKYLKYKVTKPESPNKISDLKPLEQLYHLTYLDLSCNDVWSLFPLRNLTNLTVLRLSENKITDIGTSLANLTHLTHLDLSNHYHSPLWSGNNEIKDLAPLRNLKNLERLDIGRNPIGSSISVVRNLPKLMALDIGCCGVSNLRPLVEAPGLRGAGSWVYLTHSPLTEADFPDIKTLEARGVGVSHGMYYNANKKRWENQVERCSLSYRESFRAAPALHSQLRTEPDVLAALWHDLSQVPEETALMPNYPNPFNPETWIPYQLATAAEVTVAIYAADGRFVRALALGYQPAGVYQSKGRAAYWDGRNTQGERVASSVYFYTLMAGEFTATRKLLIRK